MNALIFVIGLLAGFWIVAITAIASGYLNTGLLGIIVSPFLFSISLAVEILFGNSFFDLVTLNANASGMFYVVYGVGSGILLSSIISIIIGLICWIRR